MSKYNLSELLNEISNSSRIGFLEISAKELVDKMEEIEASGIDVDRYDGKSEFGKTNIEFHVHPEGRDEPDASFTVYDYKFGFDPMDKDHFMNIYPFRVGGRGKIALEYAKKFIDVKPEIMGEEDKKEIKEDKEKDLINALRFHVMMLEKGNIDKDDFVNAIEELAFGQRRGPNTDDDFEREQRMQMSMREEESIDEASQEESVATYIQDYYKNPKTGESMISDEMVDEFYKTHPEWEDQADGTKEGMKAVLDNFNEFFEINYGIMFDDSRDIDENLKKHFKRFM